VTPEGDLRENFAFSADAKGNYVWPQAIFSIWDCHMMKILQWDHHQRRKDPVGKGSPALSLPEYHYLWPLMAKEIRGQCVSLKV